ncbi:iron-sulfur cluster carrier protein ApbC [Suttonella ornithocola]|uniref:Iron-sulfur cluster carrier protein n=1 Tax=Suttonella ornithocola TaxID=279832 RepID=A0A380MU99_9GAMM|nr:iron-sulfur cluster carrier protein ApbC [Suttonella ornithocola]SUO95858.1 antiporter inner membrane protein [Suttonella ornithocola]
MTPIETLIHDYIDPITQLAIYRDAKITQTENTLTIIVGYPLALEKTRLSSELSAYLTTQGHFFSNILIESNITKHRVQAGLQPFPEIQNIIAIASGKGGVGKSTVSVNLAAALAQQGANVGILDADIYGPSQPTMLGGVQRPESKDGKTMEPIIRHGMQTLSIGDIVEEDTAMIWRGPMVTQTLIQLISECNWHALDYLIIDLPPGTGGTQLTLAQRIPVTGAVIVTTPQEIALLDVKRAKTMFDKVRIPNLGIIENMSFYHCPNCGHEEPIFGSHGGTTLSERYQIPLLGQIPLDIHIRESGDKGIPIVFSEPKSPLAKNYLTIALKLGWQLATQQKSYTQSFPKIIVE